MQPKVYTAAEHKINPSLIDPDALLILDRLRQAGFTAYLVGGSVRDLLINKVPKDFDISTSARPEQIKSIFSRQCILIGRRFRLAHIRFGHKIFEVSTFRSGENDSDLITHDNEWGSPQEDVLRRDFTVNGLFYDSSNHTIIDYVGGCEDVKLHSLRTIGIPGIRFKQDPVRMLRLFKFQARYDFQIEPDTAHATQDCLSEILKSSPARVLEELLRMLESGAAARFFQLMAEQGMLSILLPRIVQAMMSPQGKRIFHYLACIDQIQKIKGKNTLDRAILGCCLIFPLLEHELEHQFIKKNQIPHIGEITLIASSLIKEHLLYSFAHFPRKISSAMISIMVDQYRLTPLGNKRHLREKLFKHKNFEFALSFLKIRALVDSKLVDTYQSMRNQYKQVTGGNHKHPHPSPSDRHEQVEKRRYRRARPS